jgi:hypothetical protein
MEVRTRINSKLLGLRNYQFTMAAVAKIRLTTINAETMRSITMGGVPL